MSINNLIDASVRCVKCGAKMGCCDCWKKKSPLDNKVASGTSANKRIKQGLKPHAKRTS